MKLFNSVRIRCRADRALAPFTSAKFDISWPQEIDMSSDECSSYAVSEHKSTSSGCRQDCGAFFLEQSWTADPAKVKDGDPSIAGRMSPAWRMFLLGNGSPTRHLRLLTGRRTRVEVIEMKEVGDIIDPLAPAEVKLVPAPRLRRQVFLKTDDGTILGYAVSYWNVQTGRWSGTDT